MQKRACRVILDYNVDDSLEAFHSLKILSVYDHLFLCKAKFIYKVYHGLTPQYISENFVLRNEMDMSVHYKVNSSRMFCSTTSKEGML